MKPDPSRPPKKRPGYRWRFRKGCECKWCPWKGNCVGETWPNWIEEREPDGPDGPNANDGTRKGLKMENEEYLGDGLYDLGDGLYASFDGFGITLRAPRIGGDHFVYLEPSVLQALDQYVAALQRRAEERVKAKLAEQTSETAP